MSFVLLEMAYCTARGKPVVLWPVASGTVICLGGLLFGIFFRWRQCWRGMLRFAQRNRGPNDSPSDVTWLVVTMGFGVGFLWLLDILQSLTAR